MIQSQSKTPPASNIVSKNDLSVKNNNKNCKNSLEIPSLVTAQVDGTKTIHSLQSNSYQMDSVSSSSSGATTELGQRYENGQSQAC